jgi:hypothetical protein
LLWGFDVLGSDVLHFLGPPQLVNRRLPGVQVHPSSLGTDDAVLVDGIWCTSAARTACDVVRLAVPIHGLATLDAALRAARCTREQLAVAAAEQGGLRGVVRLRELLPHASAGAESPMESRMRWRFIDGGLPAPEVQVRVIGEERSHSLDAGWRDARVGAEFDGLEAHMTRQQLAADRDRHNWLTERHWTLLHFTVKSPGVVFDGYRVIFLLGQALSAGMVTSSVVSSVSSTGRSWQRARTSRPR